MTGSTKILTVSYGTFSCTLEGFDDPFGTMRGIAEYFRDLAADDRYFGAEPPTPDVEMLQRIAEKEVHRRVEARMGDAGVALTQVTAEAKAERAAAPEEKAEAEASQPAPAAERVTSAPRPAPEVEDDEPEDEGLDHGPLTHDDEFLMADEPEDVLAVDPDARLHAEGPAETVAEKLRRIRAVVSRSIEPQEGGTGGSFSEDQAPDAAREDEAPRRDRALSETIRQITEDLSDDEEAEATSGTPAAEFDPIDEALFETGDDDEDEAVALADDGDAARDAEDEAEDSFEPETEDDGFEPEAEDEAFAAVAGDDAFDADADAEDGAAEPEEAEDDAVLAARVAGLAATREEDDEDEDRTEAAETRPVSERRVSRPLTPITESAEDVGRLMAETDNQLNADESIRRRRVISQMRAAVAATKADRLVSRRVTTREEEIETEREAYRDDLSEAVRNVSRPLSKAETPRKPSVAPLVLVSSQRVQAESRADDAPVPTRPVRAEADAAPDAEGFAGFVRMMGARELHELLEAAAAYTAFVEGQPSFSRPEIMKRVARVDPALKLSREDGLRSFGQLLRQGKFRKLERGQFTIDESTRFRPERRFAGE